MVQDATIMLAIAMTATYLLIYKKNKLAGSLVFIAVSIGAMTITDGTNQTFSIVLLIISIISLIYEALKR